MSDNPIKSQIQGNSTGNDTIWGVTLTHDDGRTASANGFASSADARRAEEFLRLGFATGWRTVPTCEQRMMSVGLAALQSEMYMTDVNDDIDRQTISDIWDSMISEWTRLMMARIERGEEPDESK